MPMSRMSQRPIGTSDSSPSGSIASRFHRCAPIVSVAWRAVRHTTSALPNRVSITGHTAASRVPPRPGYGPWELSADRANAVRQILEDEGLPGAHVSMVAGKADSQPLFPDDPHIAANRRVTITLLREAPPLPVGFKP